MTETARKNSWLPFGVRGAAQADATTGAALVSSDSVGLGLDPEAHAKALLVSLQVRGIVGTVSAARIMSEWKAISTAEKWPSVPWLSVARPFRKMCFGKGARSVSEGGRTFRCTCYIVPASGEAPKPNRPPPTLAGRIAKLERMVAALVEARGSSAEVRP